MGIGAVCTILCLGKTLLRRTPAPDVDGAESLSSSLPGLRIFLESAGIEVYSLVQTRLLVVDAFSSSPCPAASSIVVDQIRRFRLRGGDRAGLPGLRYLYRCGNSGLNHRRPGRLRF